MSTALLNRSAISGDFTVAYESRLAAANLAGLAMMATSASAQEIYRFASSAPKLTKRLGGMKVSPLTVREIIINNYIYDDGIEIPVQDIRRDRTGEIQRKVSELAESAADLKVQLIDDLLIYGDTTTLGLAWDGQKFFDTDHSYGASGTIINDIATAQVGALTVGNLAEVTPEEAADIIMGVIAYMMRFKDDRGRPINQNSRKWDVIVPPTLAAPFITAAYANNLAGGETNPLKAFDVNVTVNGGVDWTAEIAVVNTGDVNKAFIIQEEEPVNIEMFDSSNDPLGTRERQTAKVHAQWEGGSGFGDWRKIAKATLST